MQQGDAVAGVERGALAKYWQATWLSLAAACACMGWFLLTQTLGFFQLTGWVFRLPLRLFQRPQPAPAPPPAHAVPHVRAITERRAHPAPPAGRCVRGTDLPPAPKEPN